MTSAATEINRTKLNKFTRLIEENKKLIDKRNLPGDDDKKYSMAVTATVLEEYYKLNFNEAFSAICDNGGDCKFDAFYYSDDVDELGSLLIVQSKYKNIPGDTDTFSQDDIELCLKNATAIIRGQPLCNPNETLNLKLQKYLELLKDNDNPAIRITVLFATNGVIHSGHKVLPCILEAKVNNIDTAFVDATAFGGEEKVSTAIIKVNRKDSSPIDKRNDLTDLIFQRNTSTMSGILVSCSLQSYIDFYLQYGQKVLLSQNVRFLLRKSPVNDSIKKSFIENPNDFCFLNNGVSITCSKYRLDYTGTETCNLTVENPAIVNGGQTTAVLAELYAEDPEKYKAQFNYAEILLRVFKATQEEAFSIAIATNSQNPIDIVNLKANHVIQCKVQDFFAKKGVGLIIKDGQAIDDYDDTITNERLLQSYAALYESQPAKAKVSKMVVFKSYFDKVFTETQLESNICAKLYRCYEISAYLYGKETRDNSTFLTNAWYAMIYTMRKLEPHILIADIPPQQIVKFFDKAYGPAAGILQAIIDDKAKELGKQFSLNNLFKNQEISILIDKRLPTAPSEASSKSDGN